MLVRSNLPRRLLSFVNERSPSKTWMRTVCWLSAAVEKLVNSVSFVQMSRRIITVHLRLLGRDNRVTGDELGHDTTSGLDTERKRADVDEDDVFIALFTGENTTLDGSTVGNSLIWVDTLRRLLATEVLFEELLNLGNTSGTADKNDLLMRLISTRSMYKN